MITIPQIRNVGLSAIAIFVGSACLGIYNAFLHGEIKGWADIGEAANDSLLYAVGIAFGWIALRSPLAKEVAGLLTQDSTTVTEKPSGEKVTETVKTSVQVEGSTPNTDPPTIPPKA